MFFVVNTDNLSMDIKHILLYAPGYNTFNFMCKSPKAVVLIHL